MVNFFKSPIYPDENRTLLVGLVHTFATATFIIAILFCIFFLYFGPSSLASTVIFFGVAIAIDAFISIVFLFRGYDLISAYVLSFGSWLIILFASVIYGGVQSVAYSNIVIAPIILTGMLIGIRAASIMSGITFLTGVFLWQLAEKNLLPEPLPLSQSALTYLIGTLPVMMLIPVFIRVYRRGYHLQLMNAHKRAIAESEAIIERSRNSELKAEIEERRRVEAQLIEAREEAEKATVAKSEFLANMSHEIRTPMNGVIGMTSLLDMTELTDEQQDYVETIRQSGESLLTIINEILDFSKIESGNLELEVQSFELTHCVEDALDLFSLAAFNKQIELNYWLDPTIPFLIMGDPTRLRQILVNLLGNALKFTAEGGVYLAVELTTAQAGEYEIQFSVKDTGIGIPSNKISQLFQSFSQVDSSTTRRFGGTGLGLAISKQLCELMGGKIWVESEEGQGTIFYFTLLTQPAAPLPVPEWQTIQPQLQDRKALIVDSSEISRQIFASYLRHWGMHIVTLSSVAQALAELTNSSALSREDPEAPPYELLLLDYELADVDTLQLIQASCHDLGLNDLPIILLTSILSPRDRAQINSYHVSHIVNKPVKPKPLFDAISQTLGQNVRRIDGSQGAYDQTPFSELDIQGTGQKVHDFELRILLVEDNLVNQKVALSILETLGYRADLANNGLEALVAVKRQDYNLIFMDVYMPEMNGLLAARKIRQMFDAGKQPRIIAMTAGVLPEDQRKTADAGMDDFIAKPLRIEALKRAITVSKEILGDANLSV